MGGSRNLKVNGAREGPFGIFTYRGTNHILLIELVLSLVVHKVITPSVPSDRSWAYGGNMEILFF